MFETMICLKFVIFKKYYSEYYKLRTKTQHLDEKNSVAQENIVVNFDGSLEIGHFL